VCCAGSKPNALPVTEYRGRELSPAIDCRLDHDLVETA